MADMMVMARLAQRRHGVGLVTIDHLQIAKAAEADLRNGSTAMVTGISHAAKYMAKRLGCPVLLLSQLNRAVEIRDDHRPALSDLRQSGAIEEDADVVAFVHRPELHISKAPPERKEGEAGDRYDKRISEWRDHKSKLSGVAELIIEKLRDGEPQTVRLRFDGPTTTFSEVTDG